MFAMAAGVLEDEGGYRGGEGENRGIKNNSIPLKFLP
jgi:hypothetical protein